MGNYSWDCKACGKSIREGNSPVVAGPDGWMNKAVAVFSDGSVMRGDYDGYGHLYSRTTGAETELGEASFALYHEACYEHAGRPSFDGPSRSARDQGFGLPGEIIPFPPTKDIDADVISSYESQILANVKGVLGIIQSTDLDEGTLTLKDLERILSERERARNEKFRAEMADRRAKQEAEELAQARAVVIALGLDPENMEASVPENGLLMGNEPAKAVWTFLHLNFSDETRPKLDVVFGPAPQNPGRLIHGL